LAERTCLLIEGSNDGLPACLVIHLSIIISSSHKRDKITVFATSKGHKEDVS